MTYDFDRIIDRRHTSSIKWTAFSEDVLPMWVADMDFVSPEPIRKALQAAVEHGVYGYEFATQALQKSVAARMQKLYGWEIEEKSIVAVTGLVSGFFAAASSLCQPGDGYLIQPPVYMPFNDIQKSLGFIRQEAPLVRHSQGSRLHYEIDWQGFEKAFNFGGSKTKMFLLCNPHNPSGQVYSREELLQMAGVCLKNDTVMVSDEIHSELLLGGSKHTPLGTLSPEIAQRSITLIAPSKTFNIAGLFCGFAIIPDHDLRVAYNHVVEHLRIHVSSLGLFAAREALSGSCDEWLVDLNTYLTGNRDFLVDYVTQYLPDIRLTRPAATYLAWLDCSELVRKGIISGSPFDFFINKAKVAFGDGKIYGEESAEFVRLNFGCTRRTLKQGLDRVRDSLYRRKHG